MNVVDYCKGMEMELTAWKAKMYDLTRKVESLGSKEKDKVLPNIQDLNILLSETSSRIDQLKNECPTEWSPQKKDIENNRPHALVRTDPGVYRQARSRFDPGVIDVPASRKGLWQYR